MIFVLYFKEIGYNLQYLLQMNKYKIFSFDLHLQGLIFDLKILIFNLKVWSSGLRARFGCLFSSPGTIRCFLLIEMEGLDLEVDPLGSRAHLCACSLRLGPSDVSFSLKEKVSTWSVDFRG